MARSDGLDSIISSPSTPQPLDNSQLSHTINTGSTENGDGIKSEIVLPENAISIDDINTPTTQNITSTPVKSGRRKYLFIVIITRATCWRKHIVYCHYNIMGMVFFPYSPLL